MIIALRPTELLPQMFAKVFPHSAPRICRGFVVINLWSRVVEERVVGVVTDYFNRQVVFLSNFL